MVNVVRVKQRAQAGNECQSLEESIAGFFLRHADDIKEPERPGMFRN